MHSSGVRQRLLDSDDHSLKRLAKLSAGRRSPVLPGEPPKQGLGAKCLLEIGRMLADYQPHDEASTQPDRIVWDGLAVHVGFNVAFDLFYMLREIGVCS